jgi:hypothetical protein
MGYLELEPRDTTTVSVDESDIATVWAEQRSGFNRSTLLSFMGHRVMVSKTPEAECRDIARSLNQHGKAFFRSVVASLEQQND